MLEKDEVVQDFRTLDPFLKMARNNKSNVKVGVREGVRPASAVGECPPQVVQDFFRQPQGERVELWHIAAPTELEGPGSHAPNDRTSRIGRMVI